MTKAKKPPLLEFPCTFPIKVMGNATESFEKAVYTIINKHVKNLHEGALQLNNSKQGNYLAITITIEAQNQEQLDKIYKELSDCKHVIMAL